jgi:IS30 family transposase
MHYCHLIQEERYQISALKEAGWSVRAIAGKLGRPPSTVGRELRRNRVTAPCQPQVAQLLAAPRSQRSAANARRVPGKAWAFAVEKLAETWSPEQIAGHQRAQRPPRISHETIYRRICEDKRAGGHLHLALRQQKQRRKGRGLRERRGTIPNQVSIDKRAAIVDRKGRFGDWEADLVVGARHSQAPVTLNERKSRYALLKRVAGKHAPGVRDTLVGQLKPFARLAHTLTTDNGKEFALHEQIASEPV